MPRIFAKFDPDFPGNFNFHGSYVYNRETKEGDFKGYKCVHCDQMFKHNPTISNKHMNSCKGVSRKKPKDEDDKPLVVSTKGVEWSPFEINQNFSRTKPNFRDITK